MRAAGVPSKKKQSFAIKAPLRMYLRKFTRETSLPVKYNDLMRFDNTVSLMNRLVQFWQHPPISYSYHQSV